jgi:hypothetical protein
MTQFPAMTGADSIQELIRLLTCPRSEDRNSGAKGLFALGVERAQNFLDAAMRDTAFLKLIAFDSSSETGISPSNAKITVGIAVTPHTFEEIRAANGTPPLADAPADQDVAEFELFFPPIIQLDILTTTEPGGGGAIDRFLRKFGEGIQQVELDVTDVDRATEILRTRFQWEPIYAATRPGADHTRVNFFLVPDFNGRKLLLELVEHANRDY